MPNYLFWFSKGCERFEAYLNEFYVKAQHVVSRSNKIVSLRRLASLKSDVEAIAKTALILETFTDDKKLIKLGALITIDDVREEMMKNHAMLEADDKVRLPMLSKNANKEKQIEHLVKIRKAISGWEAYAGAARIRSVLDDACAVGPCRSNILQ